MLRRYWPGLNVSTPKGEHWGHAKCSHNRVLCRPTLPEQFIKNKSGYIWILRLRLLEGLCSCCKSFLQIERNILYLIILPLMDKRKQFIIDANGVVCKESLQQKVSKPLLEGMDVTVVCAAEAVFEGCMEKVTANFKVYLNNGCVVNPRRGPFHYREPKISREKQAYLCTPVTPETDAFLIEIFLRMFGWKYAEITKMLIRETKVEGVSITDKERCLEKAEEDTRVALSLFGSPIHSWVGRMALL